MSKVKRNSLGGKIRNTIGKECRDCKVWKAAVEYKLLRGTYLSWVCRECENKRKNAAYHRDKATVLPKMKEQARRLRLEFIAAYGGKCECCGEAIPEFLTIEHKLGGGKKHVKEVGGPLGVIRDLKARGWPKDDFALLCYNCNCSRGQRGYCPHQGRPPEPEQPVPSEKPTTKRCPRCGQEKSIEHDFYRSPIRVAAPYCKPCATIVGREHLRDIREGRYLQDGPNGLGILKYCPGCDLWKVAEKDFHKHKSEKSGYQARCVMCSRQAQLDRKEQVNAASRLRMRRIRLQILAAFGQCCSCCGEDAEEFLTLDHIAGGGNKERHTPGLKGSFYERVLREGCPKDRYRLLCYNCNCARRNGACPHQKQT